MRRNIKNFSEDNEIRTTEYGTFIPFNKITDKVFKIKKGIGIDTDTLTHADLSKTYAVWAYDKKSGETLEEFEDADQSKVLEKAAEILKKYAA